MAGPRALFLLCREEFEHSPYGALGVGSAQSAQGQCSRYRDQKDAHLPRPAVAIVSAMLMEDWHSSGSTSFRKPFLNPFALATQCPGKRKSLPILPHAHPTVTVGLRFAEKTEPRRQTNLRPARPAQPQTPPGFQNLMNKFIQQICLPDVEREKPAKHRRQSRVSPALEIS